MAYHDVYRVYDREKHADYTFSVWVGQRKFTPQLRSHKLACLIAGGLTNIMRRNAMVYGLRG